MRRWSSAIVVVAISIGCRRNDEVVRADPTPPSACPSLSAAPPSSHGALPPVPLDHATESGLTHVVSIAIDAKGDLTLAGKPITAADLDTATRAELARYPDARVVIAADTHVEHGKVVALLDRLRADGVAKIAFAVSPRDAGAP